jgi:host factor-I protein
VLRRNIARLGNRRGENPAHPISVPKRNLNKNRPSTSLPAAFATGTHKEKLVANEKSQNVQDVFLNHVRKAKTPVTVFLVNGVKLQGIITWFDNFSVLLRRDGHTQLVYKHAISTVMPGAPIQLFDGPKEGAARETETADTAY